MDLSGKRNIMERLKKVKHRKHRNQCFAFHPVAKLLKRGKSHITKKHEGITDYEMIGSRAHEGHPPDQATRVPRVKPLKVLVNL